MILVMTIMLILLQVYHPKDALEQTVLVGKAISNVEIYILDSQLRPVPMGVAGELCCSGVNLAKGYWGRPEQTAEAFVDNPFAKGDNPWLQRMYRTGDLARLAEDGRIQILGRIDRQVGTSEVALSWAAVCQTMLCFLQCFLRFLQSPFILGCTCSQKY